MARMRIIGLGAAATAVAGATFVVVAANAEGNAPASSHELADRMAKAIEAHSVGDAKDLLCGSNDMVTKTVRDLNGVNVAVAVRDLVEKDGMATVTARIVRKSDNAPVNVLLKLTQHDGKWCVD